MGFTLHRGFESLPLRFPPNPHHKRDGPPPRRPAANSPPSPQGPVGKRIGKTPPAAAPAHPPARPPRPHALGTTRRPRTGPTRTPISPAHPARRRSSRASNCARRCANGRFGPRQGRQHPSRVSTCFPAPGDPAPRAAWRARPCSVSRGRPCAGHRPQSVVMAPSAGDRGPWPVLGGASDGGRGPRGFRTGTTARSFRTGDRGPRGCPRSSEAHGGLPDRPIDVVAAPGAPPRRPRCRPVSHPQ